MSLLRFFTCLIMAATFCSLANAEEGMEPESPLDYQKLVNEKLWITEHYPPHHYIKDDIIDGTIIRTLKEVFRRNNIVFDVQDSFHVFPWARALKELSTNPNAVVVSMGYTEERSRIYRLTAPVFTETIALITLKKRNLKLDDLDQLSYYFIGAVRDDIGERLLKDLVATPLNIAHVQTSDELLEMLVRGRVDMISYSQQIIDYQISRKALPRSDFAVLRVLQDVPASIAFNRESDTALIDMINQTIALMQQDGTAAAIAEQYRQ